MARAEMARQCTYSPTFRRRCKPDQVCTTAETSQTPSCRRTSSPWRSGARSRHPCSSIRCSHKGFSRRCRVPLCSPLQGGDGLCRAWPSHYCRQGGHLRAMWTASHCRPRRMLASAESAAVTSAVVVMATAETARHCTCSATKGRRCKPGQLCTTAETCQTPSCRRTSSHWRSSASSHQSCSSIRCWESFRGRR